MPMIKDFEGGDDPGESVNLGETSLQGVGEKSKHCACCPHSSTQHMKQDPQSADLVSDSELAEGPKNGPVAEPTKGSKSNDSSLECEVCEADPSATSDGVNVDAQLLDQQLLVKELLNAVIARASRKANVPPTDFIQQQLFPALWAQMKEKTLNIKQSRIKSLEKAIFKDLTKLLKVPPDHVLITLPLAQEVVIYVFKDHLFRKKRSLLRRLFAWCGNTKDDGDQPPETKISKTLLQDCKANTFPISGKKSLSGVGGSSYDADQKERVSTLINAVLSHAAKPSRHKPSVRLHKLIFDKVMSDDRIKDLYINEKKLTGVDEVIYQELRNKTFCEDKDMIVLLNDGDPILQHLTIVIIKKYLIDLMENPALSTVEEVKKYRSSVKVCIEDLVKHVFEDAESPSSPEKADAISKRLFSKVWPRIKKIRIPAEHVIFLSNMVYKSLLEKWKDPAVILSFMSVEHRYIYEVIIQFFKEHAITILESQPFISSYFSSVGRATGFAHRQNKMDVL
ncbi:shingomyelin synthase [Sarotherodon galilaeus]